MKYLNALIVAAVVLLSCGPSLFRHSSYFDDETFFLCTTREGRFRTANNAQRFGFFSSNLWENYELNLRKEIDVFGVVPGYVLWYLQIDDGFPMAIASHNKELGIHTVINQDLQCDQFSIKRNERLLQEIIEGKWDNHFGQFARDAKSLNTDVYYRFGYEMNGNWFPWGEKSGLFVSAWRHVWHIFDKEKASNVSWIFSPGVVWGGRTFERDILPYYPGSKYVDIVALDGYNFGDDHDQYHQWESFHKVFAGSMNGLMSFNKPMWIAEIGCPSEGRRVQWIHDFLDFFDSNRCFEVFFWFNENKEGEPNFRIDGDQPSLQIFREWAQRGIHKPQPADELANNTISMRTPSEKKK